MQYGLISNIDQYQDNKALEIQKIQPSEEGAKLNSKEQLQEIQETAIENEKEVSDTKKIEAETQNSNYEVVLSNTNFGFNDKSKDFYVKVLRGDAENKYPTEQMMKMKAYMMSLDTAS